MYSYPQYDHTVSTYKCCRQLSTIATHLDAICIPLLMKMAFRTDMVCPSNVLIQLQSLMAHNLRVVSPEAVSTHWTREDGGQREGKRGRGKEGDEKKRGERKTNVSIKRAIEHVLGERNG